MEKQISKQLIARRPLIAIVLSLWSYSAVAKDPPKGSEEPAFCNADEVAQVAGDKIILTDKKKGLRWTDLHIVMRRMNCLPLMPKLDLQTLKNAKFKCQTEGGRLPELSEVNDLAELLSQDIVNEVDKDEVVAKNARFKKESKYFWTATVRQEENRFVYNRALASVANLKSSSDMTKAFVQYEPASLDEKKRPFVCVFDSIPSR